MSFFISIGGPLKNQFIYWSFIGAVLVLYFSLVISFHVVHLRPQNLGGVSDHAALERLLHELLVLNLTRRFLCRSFLNIPFHRKRKRSLEELQEQRLDLLLAIGLAEHIRVEEAIAAELDPLLLERDKPGMLQEGGDVRSF